MRLGVLKEIKNLRRFLDNMEKGVKSRDPIRVSRAYTFLTILVDHMDKGDLTPLHVELVDELRYQFDDES
jgi:uncharacterized protein (DUF2267 family)